MENKIIARCMAISRTDFLNIPYKDVPVIEMYYPDGIANKATGICHYCTVDTFKSIIAKNCLRFSDVRFLNDSTEFIEIIPLIKSVLEDNDNGYSSEFRSLIRDSTEMKELKEYRQSYMGV